MKDRDEAEVHCAATNRSQEAVRARLRWLDESPKGYLPGAFHSPVEKVENPFNLENLRYREAVYDEKRKKQILITPTLIRDFVTRINELPDDGKPFVIGIGTGGTPSMDSQWSGGPLSTKFGFDGLMNHPKINHRLQEEFDILGVDLFKTDSSQLEIDDVGDLAIAMSYIWQNMRPGLRARFNGFIIIHGTDTMSKSGAHLATMLGKGMPFNTVHTGAQRSIGDARTDFPINLEDAFDTIRILENSGLAECVTVMGRKALLTIGTNKVSGYNVKAMASPRHKNVIDFERDIDVAHHKIRAKGVYRKKESGVPFEPIVYRGPNRVATLSAEMSEDLTYIMAVIRHSAAKAILLVPYPGGTYDAAIIDEIAEFARRYEHTADAEAKVGAPRPNDISIFAVHPSDEKTDLGRYAAAEAELQAAGVVPLNMTVNAARAKIMHALAMCDETAPNYKHNLEAIVTAAFIGESSYQGERYMDRFDQAHIDALEEKVPGQEGKPCTTHMSFGGELAQTQIEAMAETDFRCDNLSHVVPENAFLVANTEFWRGLLEKIKTYRIAAPAEHPRINEEMDETLIPQIVKVLNDAAATVAFMRENGIEINLVNFNQLRDEMLFIWSQLTGNNLIFTHGTRGGNAEIYVPLVGPDVNGIIRRIDHDQRILDDTGAFEALDRKE